MCVFAEMCKSNQLFIADELRPIHEERSVATCFTAKVCLCLCQGSQAPEAAAAVLSD